MKKFLFKCLKTGLIKSSSLNPKYCKDFIIMNGGVYQDRNKNKTAEIIKYYG